MKMTQTVPTEPGQYLIFAYGSFDLIELKEVHGGLIASFDGNPMRISKMHPETYWSERLEDPRIEPSRREDP